MGSEETRFPQQERRKRWIGCWGGLPCFDTQKGGKRIVPASRIPEGNASANQPNGPQAVSRPNHQATTLTPSLLAPPSSPASFTNSALPSTAQSPSCFLSISANSPGGPSSTMFATGPYAHETQLVSPPVFSTFTTEPSTAPLTPPPELAHLTTPSSPDVPYAQYLSSTRDLKNNGTYSPYPESPAGSCLSDREYPQPFPTYTRTGSARMVGHGDSNFFCPATFAQFYLDNPHSVGRLSVSRESDVYPSSGGNAGNGHHQNNNNWQNNKSSKQDVEEIEAYRASFGFSADEITTTPQYVEISDVMDESFTIMPYTSHKPLAEESFGPPLAIESQKAQKTQPSSSQRNLKPAADHVVLGGLHSEMPCSCSGFEGHKSRHHGLEPSDDGNHILSEDDIFSKMGSSKHGRKYHFGLSSSDAEIDYRRGRSLREGKGGFAWRD